MAGESFLKPGMFNFGAATPSFAAPASVSNISLANLLSGAGGGGSSNKWLTAAAIGVPALTSLFSNWQAGRTAGKSLKSQEQMMREQIAMQEKILADQTAAQREYYAQLERQWMAEQENLAKAKELQRQQFERSQGFQERQYDERKSAARPYYDYVWNYLNTPVK